MPPPPASSPADDASGAPLQPIKREMRIHLRRRDIRMPQQRLHAAQVRAMLHHMRRHAMPHLVRTRLRVQPLHHRPHHLRRQRIPADRQKQRPLHATRTTQQLRPPTQQIHLQRLHGRPPNRHNPLLVTLASHQHSALSSRKSSTRSADDLAHAQPAGIQQLQHRVVPQSQFTRGITPRRRARPLEHLATSLSARLFGNTFQLDGHSIFTVGSCVTRLSFSSQR